MSEHRPCPVNGCTAHIFAGLLMCRTHWRRLPHGLKDEVNRTWRLFSNGRTPEARRDARPAYELARRAAIDAANASAP